MDDIRDRREYRAAQLDQDQASPFELFREWLIAARARKIAEPNAMVLSTVDAEGQPSSRVLLLRKFDEQGFVFFTNYDSRKGRELAANPRAALLFYWGELDRQVRVLGTVSRVSRTESEEYFASRPRGARISAVASRQSMPIASRAELDEKFEAAADSLADREIKCPESWGGFRLSPHTFEFWQGRENRLHDRIQYTLTDAKRWLVERLQP